jgi:hypothetical protein
VERFFGASDYFTLLIPVTSHLASGYVILTGSYLFRNMRQMLIKDDGDISTLVSDLNTFIKVMSAEIVEFQKVTLFHLRIVLPEYCLHGSI